ncbi:MAG: hypothetical protein U1F57_08305 [bacterium]
MKKYAWKNSGDAQTYLNLSWKTLSMSSLQGFPSSLKPEIKGECAHYEKTSAVYLKQEGGKCNYSTWLEIHRDGKTERLDRFDQLQKIAAPVKDEEAAVSWVAVTQEVARGEGAKLSAQVAKVPDGFAVHLPRVRPFGCSDIEESYGLYHVGKDGEVKPLATFDRHGKEVCKD